MRKKSILHQFLRTAFCLMASFCLFYPLTAASSETTLPYSVHDELLSSFEVSLDDERHQCHDMIALMEKGSWQKALDLKTSHCPQYRHYATWQAYLNQLTPDQTGEAICFYHKHQQWPWRDRLREKILDQLSVKSSWTEKDRHFLEEQSQKSYLAAKNMCHRLSQKCPSFLSFWRKGEGSYKDLSQAQLKKISRDDVLHRAEKLIWRGDAQEAKLLLSRQGLIKSKHAAGLVKAIQLLAEKQTHLLTGKPPAEYAQTPALRYAYARLSFSAHTPNRFFWILKGLNHHITRPDKWGRLLYATALDLVEHGKPALAVSMLEKLEWPNTALSDDFHNLAGLISLHELKALKRAVAIFKHNRQRVKTPVSTSRADYWQGVTYESLQNVKDSHAAFKRAAIHRHTYYGQLALRKLGNGFNLPPVREIEHAQEGTLHLSEVEKRFIYMALIAKDVGQGGEALSFLQILTRDFGCTPLQKTFLMRLCMTYIPQAQVYMTSRLSLPSWPKSRDGSVVGLREAYPTFYREMIERYLQHYQVNISPSVVFALMRRESAFNPYAISVAGAEGLMQFMRPTANELAKKDRDLSSQPLNLFDEETNIRLVVLYLKELSQQYKGNLPMVFAAYNAGSGKMNEWAQRWGEPPADDDQQAYTIERFSYEETRSYVKNLLAGARLYKQLLQHS